MGGLISKKKANAPTTEVGPDGDTTMQIGLLGTSDDSSSLHPSMSQGSSYQSSIRGAHASSQGSSVSDVELSSADSNSVRPLDSRMSIDLSDEESNDSGDSLKPMQVKGKSTKAKKEAKK